MVFSCCKSRISYSNPQDQYLAYLAGEEGGKSPLLKADKKKAFSAQPHPIANKCSALATQLLPSIAASAFAVTAYLFTDSNLRATLIGEDICTPCSMNKLQLAARQQKGIDWIWNGVTDVWKQAVNTTLTTDYTVLKADSLSCAKGEISSLVGCASTNYLVNIDRIATHSPFLLAAGFGLLLGWKAMRHLERSMAKETAAEQNLIDDLQKKYQEMGERLKTRAFSCGPEEAETAKELAFTILHKQSPINQQIVDLHLPTIPTIKKATQITKPLFTAARMVADLQAAAAPVATTPKVEIQQPIVEEKIEPKIKIEEIETDEIGAKPTKIEEPADEVDIDVVDDVDDIDDSKFDKSNAAGEPKPR